jgi:hypothetical protein
LSAILRFWLLLCVVLRRFYCELTYKVKPRVKPELAMTAGINILCYKSKTLSNGEHPLMIRVCKDGKKKYLSIGISILPKFWDFEKNKPKRNCPNKVQIEKVIAEKSQQFSQQIIEFKTDNKQFYRHITY